MECLSIMGIALEDVGEMQGTINYNKVPHLVEEERVGQSKQSGAGGSQILDERVETFATRVPPAALRRANAPPQPSRFPSHQNHPARREASNPHWHWRRSSASVTPLVTAGRA